MFGHARNAISAYQKAGVEAAVEVADPHRLILLLFEGARRLPLQAPLPLEIGRAAFGIYLLHPFFALFVYKALGADVHWLPLTLLCFGLSWAATALLLRLPGLRGLV